MAPKTRSVSIRNVVEAIEKHTWRETIDLAIMLLLIFVTLAGFSLGLRVVGIVLRDMLMISGGA